MIEEIEHDAESSETPLHPYQAGIHYHAPITHSIPKLKDPEDYYACIQCGLTFSFFRKKYHCYHCGNVLCHSCTKNSLPLPKFGYIQPVRVCGYCSRLLEISSMDKHSLSRLSVKALRMYIHAYDLPADNIIEKEDLVSLIYDNQPLSEEREVYFRNNIPVPSPRPVPRHSSRQREELSERDLYNLEYMLAQLYGFDDLNLGVDEYSIPPPQPPPPEVPQEVKPPSVLSLIRDKTDISKLPIQMLKEILSDNCVTYSGVIEKRELVDRVQRLVDNFKAEMSEYTRSESEDSLCRICCDATINCVMLECGHMATCMTCGKRLKESKNECPLCREPITRLVHVFRS
ncbi:hypothetical protein K493DRAFT_337238 [Basidiobolus meristosporus CBS 931.73]|uniref:FYVE-domain-containing protein n=1 Tax=Basidiobolus meristosporus CBS 931.73 TaxID=1314790 RepID=A0A1Y1YCG5_9FUNG|nr:hypothetical protein K493DRAFT_337238 [Basidiobolus meristosporus CBS 931.73]|eukprot:ORX95677.1 hypothetical protein K493DRAFT_337238 [Basidiobolus meristosporus CBS 931.73]